MSKRFHSIVCILIFSLATNFVWGITTDKDKKYYFQRLNISDGLSQNTIHDILQDSQGFMWFGTKDGLNRYDGLSIRVFRKEGGTLGNNFITTLYEDTKGNIWVGTDAGVYVYSRETESFRPFLVKSSENTVIMHPVTSIIGDKEGNIWISVDSQGLFCYQPEQNTLQNYLFNKSKQTVSGNVTHFLFDQKGRCWISIYSDNLYYTDDHFKTLKPFVSDTGDNPFKDDIINKIIAGPHQSLFVGSSKGGLKEINLQTGKVRDLLSEIKAKEPVYVREIAFNSDDELWIGTESGLYIYTMYTEKIIHLLNDDGDNYSLSDNAIYSLYKDREGGMWIGSFFGGLNYYPKGYTYFEKFYPQGADGFKFGKRVREFCKGNDGTIWIGTEDKGLFNFNPSTGRIQPFVNPRIHNNVHGLCLDGDYLWVGTFSKGLNRIHLKNKEVKTYVKAIGENTLNSNDIFSIYRSKTGVLWVGTTYGLLTYNRQTDDFTRISELNGIFVYDIQEDYSGNLWIATYANGVYYLDKSTKRWNQFVHNKNNPHSLPNDKVLSIFEDSKKRLWFTTQGGGFCQYDENNKQFIRYDSKSLSIPSNIVFNIIEDNTGIFWVTTNNGLLSFNPETLATKIYTVSSGLLSNQFNYQSGYKDDSGKIYAGSINGFIGFDPAQFTENNYIPPVVITDFLLFNRQVPVGTKKSPLTKSITLSDQITLKSNQNSFSFRIAALSYQSPKMNQLMYKLEGFDKEWFSAKEAPVINYSNLPYGTYTFMVKGSNSDGLWNETPTTLRIRILPPFYLSYWAFAGYFLIAILMIYGVFRYLRNRSAQKHRLQMDKFEREKERELYKSKIDFFTHVAHEIRTPLTLIKSPLENVLKENKFEPEVKEDLQIMSQNTNRLLDLTNQLLDFRKTENEQFRLSYVDCNISDILSAIHIRFMPLAKQRGIDFSLDLPEHCLYASCDREALIKIVSNLFSNAVNHAESYIKVTLSLPDAGTCFTIRVSNDGEVVPPEVRDDIFKPFVQYQEGNKKQTSGTGIGLALSRSLAELHEGTLEMDDSLQTNNFILTLPVKHEQTIQLHPEISISTDETEISTINLPEADTHQMAVVLVVEDNPEMNAYICRHLSPFYTVLSAANGQAAIELLDANYVSLIVSDIMMPQIDGLELCSRVKSDLSYSHIPVVLLTAKSNLQSKIEGLRSGADAYIEKPFSVEYLQVCISNLLTNREKLRQTFVSSPFVSTNSMAITKADESFLKNLNLQVDIHMQDPDFCLDDLAGIMNMSRSSLNRKIKGMLDLTPNDYIRLERLKKAAQLLQEGECKINEICYRVGFNTPSYFTKCFQKQFGVLPKDFVKPTL